jgi:hypothetical protein
MLIPRLTTCTFETPAPCTVFSVRTGSGCENLAPERDTCFVYVTTPCDIMMHVVATELNCSVKVYFEGRSILPCVTRAGERVVCGYRFRVNVQRVSWSFSVI